jgi:hypothetical protein
MGKKHYMEISLMSEPEKNVTKEIYEIFPEYVPLAPLLNVIV